MTTVLHPWLQTETTKLLTKTSVNDPPPVACVASPLLTNDQLAQPPTDLWIHRSQGIWFHSTHQHWRAGIETCFWLRFTGNWSPFFFFRFYISHVRTTPSSRKNKGKRAVGRRGYKNWQIWVWHQVKRDRWVTSRSIKGEAKYYLELWEATPQISLAMWGDYGGIWWLIASLDRQGLREYPTFSRVINQEASYVPEG